MALRMLCPEWGDLATPCCKACSQQEARMQLSMPCLRLIAHVCMGQSRNLNFVNPATKKHSVLKDDVIILLLW
jgi:hypothetical protein